MKVSRRGFCAGVATAVLLPVKNAEARVRGAALASAFSGGRSQVNTNFPSSGEFVFLDLMKSGGTWTYVSGGGAVEPTDLDTNGYPLSIVSGGVSKTIFYPPQVQRPGAYKITWDGGGTIAVSGASLTSGSLSTSGCTVMPSTLAGTSFTLSITATTGGNRLRNMKVFHVNDEQYINAGLVVDRQFRQRALVEIKFGVIRFLNLMGSNSAGANHSALTTWASRRPVGYHTYSGQEQRASVYAGTTTTTGAKNSDNAITFNDPIYGSGAPQDKQTLILKVQTTMTDTKATVTFDSSTNTVNWTNTLSDGQLVAFAINSSGAMPSNVSPYQNFYVINRTATTIQISLTPGGSVYALGSNGSGDLFGNIMPTLNLNGTGAVPIRFMNCQPVGSSNRPMSGTYMLLIYDATMNMWVKTGGDNLHFNTFMINGTPPEVLVQIATELGMHPWFVGTAFTADPITDFFTQLATYCKNNAPSWMIPRFEPVNELWNTNSAFQQTNYAIAKSYFYKVATGNSGWTDTGDGWNEWMGRAMSQLGQAVAAVYGLGNLRTKYHTICGVQTIRFTSVPSSMNPRLTANLYVSTQGGLSAVPYTSHVCGAQYISPSIYSSSPGGSPTEQTLAAAFNGVYVTSGTITGNVLTINSTFVSGSLTSAGGVTVGQTVCGVGVPAGTTIASFGTGTGFAGTYNLSQSVPTNLTTNQAFVVIGNLANEPATYVGYLDSVSTVLNYHVNIAAWANGLGVKRMCGYEGCWSPDYKGTNGVTDVGKTMIDILRWAGKGAANLETYTKQLYDGYVAIAPAVDFVTEFPSFYYLGGTMPSDNVWAGYENMYVNGLGPDPCPQAKAIAAFNA